MPPVWALNTPCLPQSGVDSLRVLLVEDDAADVRLLCANLEKLEGAPSLEVVDVPSLAAARRELAHAAFDVVLLDLGLPDATGLEAFEGILAATDAPVVIRSGNQERDIAMGCVNLGAQDYVLKSSQNPQAVVRAIMFAVARSRVLGG